MDVFLTRIENKAVSKFLGQLLFFLCRYLKLERRKSCKFRVKDMEFNSSIIDSSGRGYIPGYDIRTDLAIEAHEVVTEHEELPGVSVEKEGDEEINISRVSITTEQAAKKMGKEVGNYLTLEVPGLRNKNTALQDRVIDVFYKELQKMFDLSDEQSVMVI